MKQNKAILFSIIVFLSLELQAQNIDEIISGYINFTGGAQQWKKIKTIMCSGTYNYGGMEFPFQSYSKAPNLYKYIVTANGKSFMQAYDGKDGWRIDGFKNETVKTRLSGKASTTMANESDVELENLFIDYKTKGYIVIPGGTDTVNTKPCYKIKLIKNDGDTATYFFDTLDFALVKKQAVAKNTELENAVLDIFYSDYVKTNGINLPRKIACTSNGQDILIITVKDVKFNEPVADAIFKY